MIISVDIDGTLLYSIFDAEKCEYFVVEPRRKIIKKINELYDVGHRVIINTGRHWNHMKTTITQLNLYGVKYHSLVMGKIPADIIIDDKSMKPEDFLNEF